MKKLYFILLIFILTSCASSNEIVRRSCEKIKENSFKTILFESERIADSNRKVELTEAQFICVHSALYTKKIMFDNFGKWTHTSEMYNIPNYALIWEHVQIFNDDVKKFNVATFGKETERTIYTSVMVWNDDGDDLLSADSNYRNKLIDFFSQKIKSNDPEKKEFYDEYFKLANPAQFKMVEDHLDKKSKN